MDDFSDLSKWERYLILLGSGMTSSKRGVQQLANAAGLKKAGLGTSDADMADIAFEQKASKKLSDATPGGWLAEAAGNMVDPISLAAGGPLGSAAKTGALALARRAALSGALTGGLSEVKEDGSRLGNMAFGAGSSAAMPVAGGVKNIWAGKRAVLTDAERAAAVTGYGGAPRTWIDQSKTKMRPEAIADMQAAHARMGGEDSFFSAKLGSLMDAPEMFRAYPDLAHTLVSIKTGKDVKHAAGYMPDHNGGSVQLDTSDLGDQKNLYMLIHEIQHKIQNFEGHPEGDNPRRLAKIIGDKGSHAYLANPGEIEARDAAARAMMDPKNNLKLGYGSLHNEGPNAKMFDGAELMSPLPSMNINTYPPNAFKSGILSAAATEPALFNHLPLDTHQLTKEKLLDAVARGVSPADYVRSLRMPYWPE